MSADSNKAAAQAAYDGFKADDLQPLISILADDVEWGNYEDNPFKGKSHGPDAAMATFSLMDSIELTGFDIESLMAEGDRVITVLNVGYTVKATGKSWQGMGVHVMDFRDGKIVRFREVAATSAEAWS